LGSIFIPSDLSSSSAYLAFEPSEEKQEKVCGYEGGAGGPRMKLLRINLR